MLLFVVPVFVRFDSDAGSWASCDYAPLIEVYRRAFLKHGTSKLDRGPVNCHFLELRKLTATPNTAITVTIDGIGPPAWPIDKTKNSTLPRKTRNQSQNSHSNPQVHYLC